MTLWLWFVGFALLASAFAAWRPGRETQADRWWLYPVELGAAAEPGSPALRLNPRPTAQAGVAILALALALDVSAAAAPAPDAHGLVFDAHASTGWAGQLATDGWFV